MEGRGGYDTLTSILVKERNKRFGVKAVIVNKQVFRRPFFFHRNLVNLYGCLLSLRDYVRRGGKSVIERLIDQRGGRQPIFMILPLRGYSIAR